MSAVNPSDQFLAIGNDSALRRAVNSSLRRCRALVASVKAGITPRAIHMGVWLVISLVVLAELLWSEGVIGKVIASSGG
jgi:hypothetical protein